MKKTFLAFMAAACSFSSKADYIDATRDGSIIVVHETAEAGRLYVVTPAKRRQLTIKLRESANDWAKILGDSYVIVHYHSGDMAEIYDLMTGKLVKSLPQCYYPDADQKYLYQVSSSGGSLQVERLAIGTFTPLDPLNGLEGFKSGAYPTPLCKISANGKRVAVVMNSGRKAKVVVYDLQTGKIVESFSGYNSYSLFDVYLFPAGKKKNDIAFLDINSDGSKILVGNKSSIDLYDVNKGKKLGSFDENPDNQREEFSNTFFSGDDKTVYIGSLYKIYYCSPDDLHALENIYIDQREVANRQIDKFNMYTKVSNTTRDQSGWSGMAVSADNRYLFSVSTSYHSTPYLWRFDIVKDGDAYYFYYK